MGAAADANFVDKWIAINQPPRERGRVRDFLLQGDDVDADIGKSSIDQRFLYRVDRVAAERHLRELRRVGRKETSDDLVCDPAKRVVPVRIPDAEQIAATGRQHATGL